MNRRKSIKHLATLSAGLISLPAWANGWRIETLNYNASVFSSSEQEILAAVVDAIIPAGDSIGALTVGVDKFLEKLFAQCYEVATQENVKRQLNNLETQALSEYGKSYSSADILQRQALLLKMAEDEPDKKDFLKLIKSETIRGYSTSKEVMGDHLKYKVIPGHYKGCVEI